MKKIREAQLSNGIVDMVAEQSLGLPFYVIHHLGLGDSCGDVFCGSA